MYEQQPDLAGTEQHIMLQLLLLADEYEVPAVMTAAAKAFSSTPTEQLHWDAALAV
jgi:hypothetical protein